MVTVRTADHRAMKSGGDSADWHDRLHGYTPYSQCDEQEWELKTITNSSAITDSVDWFGVLLISVDILCGKKRRFHCNVSALVLLYINAVLHWQMLQWTAGVSTLT